MRVMGIGQSCKRCSRKFDRMAYTAEPELGGLGETTGQRGGNELRRATALQQMVVRTAVLSDGPSWFVSLGLKGNPPRLPSGTFLGSCVRSGLRFD